MNSIKIRYNHIRKLKVLLENKNRPDLDTLNNALHQIEINMKDYLSGKKVNLIDETIYVCNLLYENNYPTIDDDLYDRVMEIHAPYNDIKFTRSNVVKESNHDYPELRGTLLKTNFIYDDDNDRRSKTYYSSLEKYINRLQEHMKLVGIKELRIYSSLKYDGVSVILSLDRGHVVKAILRGDETTGIDVTDIFKSWHIWELENYKNIGMKCECVLSYESFKDLSRMTDVEYMSPRTMIAGLLNSDEIPDYCLRYIDLQFLTVSIDGKITQVPNNIGVIHHSFTLTLDNSKSILDSICDYVLQANDDRYTLYPVDGIVFTVFDQKIMESMGRTNSINRWEVAYKFSNKRRLSKIRDIEYSVGSTGKINIMGVYDPVSFEGSNSNYTRASIGSYDVLMDMDLYRGKTVAITLNNDIIPQIQSNRSLSTDNNIYMERFPKLINCPSCGSKLIKKGSNLFCLNEKCPSKVIKSIVRFLKSFQIKGVSDATVEKMYNSGIDTICKVMRSSYHELSYCGIGPALIDFIMVCIDDLSNTGVKDHELLVALGICGEKTAKDICKHVNILELLSTRGQCLYSYNINGVSELTINKIIDSIHDIQFELDDGLLNMIKIISTTK